MEGTLRQIALSEIRDHVGSPPSTRFRKSIRRMGVVQPVLLHETIHETGELRYEIIDGNRRVSAARTARMKSVPAIVLSGLSSEQVAQLTLVLNSYRSANYLTEFWAIKSLGRSKFSSDEIQDLAGLSYSTMEHRDSFARLNREIFVALRNGKITQHNASAVAKLPPSSQEELAQRFREKGRLAKWEIDEAARALRISARTPLSTMPEMEPIRFIAPSIASQSSSGNRLVSVGVELDDIDTHSEVVAPVINLTTDNTPHTHDQASNDQPYEPILPEHSMPGPDLHITAFSSDSEDNDLTLDEQLAKIQLFREQLVAAANTASELGMDRLRFLTQASQIWDIKRESLKDQQQVGVNSNTNPEQSQFYHSQQGIQPDGKFTSAD